MDPIDLTADDSPSLRRNRHATKDQEEKDRVDKTLETKEWFNDYRRTDKLNLYDSKQGKAVLPVELLCHPEECIEARVRREEIHESVYHSMKKMGVGRTDVVILVWEEDLEENAIEIDNMPSTASALKYQVLCGDHTVSAMSRLHKENPGDDQYKSVACEVVICPKTQHNIRLAYNFGALDNELKAMTTGITSWDVVVKIHNTIEEVKSKPAASTKAKKAQKELMDKELTEIYKGVSGKYSKLTFGSMRVLGSKTGKIWDNIKRLFDTPIPTKVPKGQPKPVTPSVGHFYGMANIPEERLVKWSDRFFRLVEPWNSLIFKKRCETWKKEKRVKGQMLDYVNIKYPDDLTENWGDLCQKYPFFADEHKVAEWIGQVGDQAKSQLITHVKQNIISHIEALKRAKKSGQPSDPEVQSCSLCEYACMTEKNHEIFFVNFLSCGVL